MVSELVVVVLVVTEDNNDLVLVTSHDVRVLPIRQWLVVQERRPVGGQDDVSTISIDEDYETGTEVIDLIGEDD